MSTQLARDLKTSRVWYEKGYKKAKQDARQTLQEVIDATKMHRKAVQKIANVETSNKSLGMLEDIYIGMDISITKLQVLLKA